MEDVVIAGYLRTAQTRSTRKEPGKDWFIKLRGDDFLSRLLPELLNRTGIKSEEIDDFLVGCAFGVNEQWTYGGRIPVFMGNMSEKIPAKFLDQQCGSGMASIHVGFMEIASGNADIVLACGMEHLTHIPNGPPLEERGFIDINHRLFTQEEYKHWDILTTIRMGLTAEKLFLQTKFTREDMDRWAVRSHELAAKALKDGFFKGEILPIEAEQSDGTTMSVDRDQSIREDATYEALAALKPAFKTDGAVTAGSSSALTVGAGCTLLMSKETAKKKKIQPLATIRSIGVAGVDPTIMGVGPVPSTLKALQKAKLNVKDIDYWEINEAFCIVTLNCIKELGIDADKVNVMGGGIAIGHPLGATGIRLVGTLARILQLKGGRYGCATACVGGGQGVTTIIEKEPS